jgi:hypothetical protein
MNQRQFLIDGSRTLFRMCFPVLYRGRVLLQLSIPPAIADQAKVEIDGVQIYNAAGPRKFLSPEELTKDKVGRFCSPDFCLV